MPAASFRSLRLVAQDTALSRREQGFETPRERQFDPATRLNTHLHPDRCGGNAELARLFSCEALVPRVTFSAVDTWDAKQLSFEATGQFCDRFKPPWRECG
jgi:glyoxylase-like metal-dependent hydrolase (beta-lactamase superfamily II)